MSPKRITRRAFSASIPLLASLPRGACAAGSAPSIGQLRATVLLNGATYEYDEAAGRNVGDYVDPAGRFTMSCVRVTRSDCPLRVDFRRIPGWACAIFEFGDPFNPHPENLPAYRVAIVGQTISVPAHWWYARWRWQSGAWPLPLASIADLTAKKLLPRFDPSVTEGTAGPLPAATYTPMGLAGITPGMGATGERADIGLVTDWQGEYICTGRPRALANVLAQGEAGGTLPWMWRDPRTGAPMDIWNTHPHASLHDDGHASPLIGGPDSHSHLQVQLSGPPNTALLQPGQHIELRDAGRDYIWVYGPLGLPASGTILVPAILGSGNAVPIGSLTGAPPGISASYVQGSFVVNSGIGLDSAHMPAIAYLPFLLTGDPYFLETLQCQVLYAFLEAPRAASGPYLMPGAGQARGMAWNLRSIMQAAAVTPASVPSWLLPQAVMQRALAQCVNALTGIMNDGSGRANFGFMTVAWGQRNDGVQKAGTYIAPWNEDFLLAVLAWAKLMGFTQFDPVLRFSIPFATNRLSGSSGWPQGVPEVYELKVRPDTSSPVYANWTDLWNANAPLLGITTPPTLAQTFSGAAAFDYPSGMRAALALAVQAGHTEARLALDTLAHALQAGLHHTHGAVMEWKWAIAG
jgi:hypothetical protein